MSENPYDPPKVETKKTHWLLTLRRLLHFFPIALVVSLIVGYIVWMAMQIIARN